MAETAGEFYEKWSQNDPNYERQTSFNLAANGQLPSYHEQEPSPTAANAVSIYTDLSITGLEIGFHPNSCA